MHLKTSNVYVFNGIPIYRCPVCGLLVIPTTQNIDGTKIHFILCLSVLYLIADSANFLTPMWLMIMRVRTRYIFNSSPKEY